MIFENFFNCRSARPPCHKIKAKDNFDFGYQLGERVAPALQAIAPLVKKRIDGGAVSDEEIEKARRFLSGKYPDLANEICGLVDGARVPLEIVLALNFFENLIWPESEHCSLIFKTSHSEETLLGWNEDGNSIYSGQMSLVEAILPEGSFVTLNYPGLLCGDTLAITSQGLVIALQGLSPLGSRVDGLPMGLVGRIILKATDLSDIWGMLKNLSWFGFSQGFHIFAYEPKSRQCLSLEVFPGQDPSTILWGRQTIFPAVNFIHTNHYLYLEGESREQKIASNSLHRLGYLRVFKDSLDPKTPEDLSQRLSGFTDQFVHSPGGEGICRKGQTTMTLHSQIVSFPKKGPVTLWTSPGRPDAYSFKEWQKKKIKF